MELRIGKIRLTIEFNRGLLVAGGIVFALIPYNRWLELDVILPLFEVHILLSWEK